MILESMTRYLVHPRHLAGEDPCADVQTGGGAEGVVLEEESVVLHCRIPAQPVLSYGNCLIPPTQPPHTHTLSPWANQKQDRALFRPVDQWE